MDEPIIIKFKWTADELITASRLHRRHSPHVTKVWLIRFLGWLSVPIGFVILLKMGYGDFVATLFATVVIAVLISLPWLGRHSITRNFAKRPDCNLDLEWAVTPHHIVTKTTGSHSEIEWHLIARVIRTPKGFLFYPNDHLFYWLPAHGFRGPHDIERTVELAKAKVKDYRDAT